VLGGGLNLAHRLAQRGVEPRQYLRIMELHEQVLRNGADAGELEPGDVRMLATLLAALVSTYLSEWMQAAGRDRSRSRLDERFTRDDLHALVERTFAVREAARGA
jgi:hypothetical protein